MNATSPVSLRAMRPEDEEEVLDLWVASWQAAYPTIDFAARRTWMAERLNQHQREGALCLVASIGGKVHGLMVLNCASEYLDQIAVGPDDLGSGIGGALVDEAKHLCPRGFALHVNQDNARAIRFYEKHGFIKTGESVNPRSGAPIFLMRWTP